MNIKKSTSLSSKISLAIGSLAIVGCTSFYSVSAAQHTGSESFHHEVEDDGSSQITWIADGKTFQDDNGMRFIVEGSDKRAMNKAEHQEFEQAVERSNVQREERELRRSEIEIERAERDMARHATELDHREREMERQEREMERHEREMERYQQEMEKAEIEVEKAQREMELSHNAGEISEKEIQTIREDLSRAKQGLRRDRKNLQRDTKRARADMQRARTHLKRAQADLKMPKAPKKVAAPKETLAPISPQHQDVDIPDAVEPVKAPLEVDPASVKLAPLKANVFDTGLAH